MDKIVVVGDEEFTMGFELVGIESAPVDKFESLLDKGAEVGIIIISQKDHETLSMKVKTQLTRQLKPIVVILSEEDIKGNSLREKVVKALGVDLMK